MKVRAYYYIVADGNEDGMPLDGPFATAEEAQAYAKDQYGVDAAIMSTNVPTNEQEKNASD